MKIFEDDFIVIGEKAKHLFLPTIFIEVHQQKAKAQSGQVCFCNQDNTFVGHVVSKEGLEAKLRYVIAIVFMTTSTTSKHRNIS